MLTSDGSNGTSWSSFRSGEDFENLCSSVHFKHKKLHSFENQELDESLLNRFTEPELEPVEMIFHSMCNEWRKTIYETIRRLLL